MDWTRIDTDLVTDAARNGITEAAAELARREQAQAAGNNALMTEAAQKIDELRAENERLKESVVWDVVNALAEKDDYKRELAGALAENARLRSLLAGIIDVVTGNWGEYVGLDVLERMGRNTSEAYGSSLYARFADDLAAAIAAAKEAVK